ncbi:MAG: bifunctional folylpolyglutamate synthase/dihydrofolate synthase [Coriobacteriales bacterium]|nr:bifunctional folylpolyglutamate synthase/dihydrofolate synthase [Coriobacteriales bacterium]
MSQPEHPAEYQPEQSAGGQGEQPAEGQGEQPAEYQQALEILHDALTFGIDPSLEPITRLSAALGNPQQQYRCIQIAGTNGKSSTSRFVAALLQAHGFKVGLYTSPELVYYEERMEIDGRPAGRADFARAILRAHDAWQPPPPITEFELLTAAALWLFAQQQVDWAVLECGLGGRWDATSVVTPEVAVVTGVDLDHTHILGDTIEQIAAEKAAIIKPGGIAVLGPGIAPARQVFLQRCAEVGVQPLMVGEADLDGLSQKLAGSRFPAYQLPNIATALVAAEAALGQPLDTRAAKAAFATVRTPGRFELLRTTPPLLIDAAHNPQSAQVLAEALLAPNCPLPLDTLLLAVLADKDATGIIAALAPLFKHLAVTQTASPRAIPAAELATLVANTCGREPEVFANVAAALTTLTARQSPTVATGSITLAGAASAHVCALYAP